MKNFKESDLRLPDFRNKGVLLRAAVLAEGASLAAAYAYMPTASNFLADYVQGRQIFEPALLLSLFLLFLLQPILAGLPYRRGVLVICGVTAAAALTVHVAYRMLFPEGFVESPLKAVILAVAITLALLAYFNWRHRALSPSMTEARLIALQARIRPHFLFNSLNTVLGLIREEPRRAEAVLENLAELYRSLLSEVGSLTPLARELELGRAYLDIEAMRLGQRLAVDWQCQGAPMDALVPPLILQPLLENAVYHGVEPSESGGTVNVTVFLKGAQLNMVVRNPCQPTGDKRPGNRMAMNNIRERLALHFDVEAEMSAYQAGGEYVVQIRLPYRPQPVKQG
jgi:two-component system sensor histidine kinase AlgZ